MALCQTRNEVMDDLNACERKLHDEEKKERGRKGYG